MTMGLLSTMGLLHRMNYITDLIYTLSSSPVITTLESIIKRPKPPGKATLHRTSCFASEEYSIRAKSYWRGEISIYKRVSS